MTKRLLVSHLLALSLFFHALGFIGAQAQQRDNTLSHLVNHLVREEGLQATDITAELPKPVPAKSLNRRWSYDEIEASYNQRLQALINLYPRGTFDLSLSRVLGSFSGKERIGFFPAFAAPFLLLAPDGIDPRSLRAYKLKLSFEGTTIYGLRVTGVLHHFFRSLIKRQPPFGPFRYTDNLNARMLGFTHAQVIAELSKNVRPSTQFDYNGPRDWSTHERLKPSDQFEQPIALTNIAHETGHGYVISRHPDFSMDAAGIDSEEVRITFFLWREGRVASLVHRFGSGPQRLPDFVYQFVLQPKSP